MGEGDGVGAGTEHKRRLVKSSNIWEMGRGPERNTRGGVEEALASRKKLNHICKR